MNKCRINIFTSLIYVFFVVVSSNLVAAQESIYTNKLSNNVWQKTQYGGSIGFNFSGNVTDILVAPSVLYNYNKFLSYGAGIILNYSAQRNVFSNIEYGINTIVLFNPLPEIQLSIGLNQSFVQYREKGLGNFSENYLLTSLIPGIGYRTGNVTIGFGYNLLKNNRFQREQWTPFVRVYF